MKESARVRNLFLLTGIFFILVNLAACKKTEYPLKDPSTADVWTLYSENTGLPYNQINDIKRDLQGNLWVTFAYTALGKYSNGAWTYYTKSNSPLLTNSVTALEKLSDGSIAIGSSNGLYFRTPAGVWSYYKDPNVTTMRINAIKQSSDGTIWVGTNGQSFYYSNGTTFVQVPSTTFNYVNAIEEDKDGNLWFGTTNGLLKWDGSQFTLATTNSGLPDNYITSLYVDKEGVLWIGTAGGFGVGCYKKDTGFKTVSLMNGLAGCDVRDIYEDQHGDLWFALWWEGLIKYDRVIGYSYKKYNGFFDDDVDAIEEDADGNLWFGLYNNGLAKYTLPLE